MLQQELGISPAATQPHPVQCVVEKAADLFEVARRRDELQAAQILTLRHAVDDVGVIHLGVVAGRIKVFDAGIAVERDHPVAQPMQLAEPLRLLRRNLRL
jgi:hypothetical protein